MTEPLEKAILGSILMDSSLALDLDIEPYMFEIWRNVANEIWGEISSKGSTNASTIAYECEKKSICPKDAIWSIVASISGDVKEHCVNLQKEWLRRQEINLHETALSELLAGEDPVDVILKEDSEREMINGFSGDKNQTRVELCNTYLDYVIAAKNGTLPTGYTTGLSSLDRLTGGVGVAGRFRVWAARPGMGKSTITLRVATAAANAGCPTALFMLEMIFNQVAEKYVQSRTGISRVDLQDGKITDSELKGINSAIEDLHDLPIYVEDSISDINRIVNKIRQYVRRYGVKLVIIDYLQLVQDNSQKWGNAKHLEVENISRKMALLCQTEQIDIIALSQLSRAVETRGGDKRPMMSDLRHSGAVEQDAGQILFFYRPDYYDIKEDHEGESLLGMVEFIQAKDRYRGNVNSCFGLYRQKYDDYLDAGFGKFKRQEGYEEPEQPNYNPHIAAPQRDDNGDDIPF